MNKKKTVKNIKTPNKFNIGGIAIPDSAMGMINKLTSPPVLNTDAVELVRTNNPKKASTLGGLSLDLPQNALSGITSGITGVASKAISKGRSTIGGDLIGTVGSSVGTINPLIGAAITTAGAVVNNVYGSNFNDANIEKVEEDTAALNAFNSKASNTNSLAKEASYITKNFGKFNKDYIGEDGVFSHKVDDKYQELIHDRNIGINNVVNQLNNSANNISANTLANLERNYAAFGGPLFAYGGQTHGADFSNGLMFINNGGTHETNPYEGVPISIDQEGNPNLVEEGEIVWNDYVFSDRLKVPKAVRTKYKLRGPKDMTFADAIEKLSKESEERPNDPISKRGLNKILPLFMLEQETLKMKKGETNKGNKFDGGGPLNEWLTQNGYANNDAWLTAVNTLTDAEIAGLNLGDRATVIQKATDGNPGATYNAVHEVLSNRQPVADNTPTPPATVNTNRYYIRNADGTATQMTEDLPFEGLNENGRTWGDLHKEYIFAGKQVRPQQEVEGTPTIYTDYYYDVAAPQSADNTKTEPVSLKTLPTWMRYAPVIGHGALALTDALGITNKPDYTNAEAIINAANNVSNSNIKFNPIGDYLTYNPFDTEYHANQLRSVAGATRRHVMNTSGGNRAAAMAGILAADNNTMNQMGDLYRKTAEYNLEQRHEVADFNRATNITNSEGMFRADATNQAARQAGLQALISGYTMKEQAKLMSDQAKAANISGLIQSLGDIGYENFGMNQVNWRTTKGVDGPGTETYLDDITGKTRRQARREARKAGKQ